MMEDASSRSLVGVVLDGIYEVERVLAEGGMATVYEALHLRLGKRVAVKVIAHALVRDPEALARFRREAEVTSALGHPHIVQVFDVGVTPNGLPFLVMELLEGEDLEHRLRRVGTLPASSVLRIVQQIATALAAAHGRGVVHRDLKPANIFLLDVAGETDFVKVLDFGVSKARAVPTNLTGAFKLVGTPQYMAPEQAQGLADQIDERSDQWALACVAWEMLSSEPPFVGDHISVLYRVVHEMPPALAAKESPLPFMVEAVLRRALAKSRGDRFPDIADFAAAFAQAITAPERAATDSSADDRTAPAATLFGHAYRQDGTQRLPPWPTEPLLPTLAERRRVGPMSMKRRRRASLWRSLWAAGIALIILGGVASTLTSGVSPPDLPIPPPASAGSSMSAAAALPQPARRPDQVVVSPPSSPPVTAENTDTPVDLAVATPSAPDRRPTAEGRSKPAAAAPRLRQPPAPDAKSLSVEHRLIRRL